MDEKNDVNWIKLGFADINGVFRGKVIHRSKFEKSAELGYCDVVFGWDLHDEVYPKDNVSGWQNGFPDARASIDYDTRRVIPWDGMPLYIIDFREDSKISQVCPRTLLRSVLKKYTELGYQVKVGFEYEWFNFFINEHTHSNPATQSITDGMYGYSLLRLEDNHEMITDYLELMREMDITIEGFHTETGPGVYEAAIKYDDALTSADRAVLFKHFTKTIFRKYGILASFMAKWNQELPGCSGHVHISMIDKDGRALSFADMQKDTNAQGWLAGVLDYMPSMMPMYGPTVNSYKRLVSGSWAPTAAAWGIDNRTSSVRVIPGDHDRVEVRITAADSHPYIALYAMLSSGLKGMQDNRLLQQQKPVGNAYENHSLPLLPTTLGEACQKMRNEKSLSSFMNGTFLDYYLMTRELEYKKYSNAVTDWEIKRYLEII